MGFVLIATVLLFSNGTQGALVLLSVAMLTGMIQLLLIYEEISFYRHLDSKDPNFYQLNRTKTLLQDRFGGLKRLRLYSLVIFGVILPLIAILLLASGLVGVAKGVLIVTLVGALVSELIGRYLFYRSVVPLGLAGNFFAGNQRG